MKTVIFSMLALLISTQAFAGGSSLPCASKNGGTLHDTPASKQKFDNLLPGGSSQSAQTKINTARSTK